MKKDKVPLSPEMREKRKKNEMRHRRDFFIKLGTTIAAIWFVFTFVLGMYRVSGNYMYPHMKDGDMVFTYRLANLSVGDVVAYDVEGTEHIGRVAAVAGITFDINDNGEATVDGTPDTNGVFYETVKDGSRLDLPYTVKEDEVIVLNDLRTDIGDSRTYGAIRLDDVDGKVIMVHRGRNF